MMETKRKYTEADIKKISKIAKFVREGDVISHTHTVIFGRPLSTAERRLFAEVLTGFYYTVYFSQKFEAEFVSEPVIEFDSPTQARFTFRQRALYGSWKELLFAVLLNFSHEVVPILRHDESTAFDPTNVKVTV
jgi:hypothetical protein